MFEFALFLTIFLIGAYYIMETYCPGVFSKSYQEITSVTTFPSLIAEFIYNGGVKILQLPDALLSSVATE